MTDDLFSDTVRAPSSPLASLDILNESDATNDSKGINGNSIGSSGAGSGSNARNARNNNTAGEKKQRRENPFFANEGGGTGSGPRGTYRELRVWQLAVQLAARMHDSPEMRLLTDRNNAFAQRAVERVQLVAACVARSNVHYGIASTPQIDVTYRLERYDRAIAEVEQALFHAVDMDSSLATMVEMMMMVGGGAGAGGGGGGSDGSDELRAWTNSESQRLVVGLRNMLRPMISARLALLLKQKQEQAATATATNTPTTTAATAAQTGSAYAANGTNGSNSANGATNGGIGFALAHQQYQQHQQHQPYQPYQQPVQRQTQSAYLTSRTGASASTTAATSAAAASFVGGAAAASPVDVRPKSSSSSSPCTSMHLPPPDSPPFEVSRNSQKRKRDDEDAVNTSVACL